MDRSDLENMGVVDQLRYAMVMSGLAVRRIARELRCDHTHLLRFLRGERLTSREYPRLCRYFRLRLCIQDHDGNWIPVGCDDGRFGEYAFEAKDKAGGGESEGAGAPDPAEEARRFEEEPGSIEPSVFLEAQAPEEEEKSETFPGDPEYGQEPTEAEADGPGSDPEPEEVGRRDE